MAIAVACRCLPFSTELRTRILTIAGKAVCNALVRRQLKPQGSSTKVLLDYTGFPQGDDDHLEAGSKAHSSDGLARYLG